MNSPARFRKSQKKRLYAVLGSCLERFKCHKEDEFHFKSPEFLEGIPPFACEFARQSHHNHLLAAADEDGHVAIYDTNTQGQESLVKEWSAHKNAIFDVAWASTEPRLVTASGDQSAALWDSMTSTHLASFKQHKCSLKSVSFRPWDSHVFATGARDGSIMIWDDRCKKRDKGSSQLPVGVINEAHVDQKKVKAQPRRRKKLAPNLPSIDSSHSVSVVMFQKEDTLLSAGAADGIVKVWDLRKLKTSGTSTPAPSHQFPYAGTSGRKRGFSSLVLSSNRSQVFASCTDSVIYEYDLSGVLGTRPLAQYKSHMNSTFFVRAAVSPDDLFLLSGSSDSHAYIWKIGEPESPPLTLVGHDAEVTSVAWCPEDFTKVVTCSDDNTMRIWKLAANVKRSDDGHNNIIGTAQRCEKQPELECKGKSGPSACSEPTDSTQSAVGSTTPISTRKTGESSSSPLSSPIPASTKKRKFSLRDWVTTSPSPSRPSSPVSPSKRTRSASTPCSSVAKVTQEGARNETACAARKRNCQDDATDVDASKKLKVSHREGVLKSRIATDSVSSDGSLSTKRVDKENGPALTEQRVDAKDQNGHGHGCDAIGLDKENRVEKGRSTTSPSKIPLGQRSPLKDYLPMNSAKRTSNSHSAKKNIASCFPNSPEPVPESNDPICDKEECGKETKQQNLKSCFKDKKVGKFQKTTKRRSGGTIEGYFQPVTKRHKSET